LEFLGLYRAKGDMLRGRKRKVYEGDALDKGNGETMDKRRLDRPEYI
jgi:hypothetical protein